ncbi:MAG: hypothetical protein IK151_06615, partial [Erysipelotrichaceae bacterium]|nr:hypothetical protein [Erysipelotrichaceae bacterium]
MKKFIKYLFLFLILCSTFTYVSAEEAKEDMSKWRMKILLQHCDQHDEIKIVRFYNTETDSYGFCLEPEVDYNPYEYEYIKQAYINEDLFNIYKAFAQLGKTEEYYIAAQLMIWELMTGKQYTFDSKGAADYGEETIKETIASFSSSKDNKTIEINKDVLFEDNNTIEIENLNSYQLDIDPNEIIEMTDDSFTIKLKQLYPLQRTINLTSLKKEINGSVIYSSEESQNLFSYEGDFDDLKDIRINLNI